MIAKWYPSALTMLLIAGAGCSTLRNHEQGKREGHLQRRRTAEESPETIIVGGHVHQPGEIKVGPDGLTLRNALTQVGGARESSLVAAPAALDRVVDKRLRQFVFLSSDLGKYELIDSLYQSFDEQVVDGIVGSTKAKTANAQQQASDSAKNKFDELVVTFSKERLEDLRAASENARMLREQLRLFEHSQVQSGITITKDALERLADEADEEVELILSEFGAPQTNRSRTAAGRATYLVAVERRDSEGPVTYFFPYRLAVAGAAGDVYLQPGDVVQVMDMRDTSLNPSLSNPNTSRRDVALQGLLADPRVAENLASIGQLHLSAQPTTTDPRGVWTLVRPAAGGLGQDVFVLPRDFVLPGGPAAESITRGGDIYTYTILPQVPIVRQSLIETALGIRQREAARMQLAPNNKALAKFHDRLKEKRTEHIERKTP